MPYPFGQKAGSLLRAALWSLALLQGAVTTVDAQSAPNGPTAGAPSASAAPTQEPENSNRPRLMVGVSVKSTMTPGPDTNGPSSIDFAWRWRGKTSRRDDRFAFAYRISSFRSQISSPFAGQQMSIGAARLRPLMAGFDYKMPRGKWTWSAGVTGGWSINRLRTADAERLRIANVMGSSDLIVDLHNSAAISPRVKGWYDLTRRVSFMIESSYTIARPLLTMRAAGVESSRRLIGDAFIVKAGVVYGIWPLR